MATPALAGLTALVRQYFMDPRYWSTVCSKTYRSCGPLKPSGSLLKSILLHSGSAMRLFDGNQGKTINLNDPPDNIQGYGRAQLNNVLPFPRSNFDLYVSDTGVMKPYSSVQFYVHVEDPSVPLK